LIEKNYENLVEELAKNVISSVVADSSSNPKLSSTFPNLLNQSDTYRIEEAEIYHNSEDDISD
jgi:hypothetical protein